MKDLIRHILKEESSDKLIKKGIDITINILKKEFPFIVGWDTSDDYNDYKMSLYINLILDYDKTKEYYGLEERRIRPSSPIEREFFLGKGVAYPTSPFQYEGIIDAYEERSKIQEYVSSSYEYIPDDLKMMSTSTYSDVYKELKVDDFIFV